MSEEKPWLKLYPNEIPSTLAYPEQPVQEFLVAAANEFPEKSHTLYGERIYVSLCL